MFSCSISLTDTIRDVIDRKPIPHFSTLNLGRNNFIPRLSSLETGYARRTLTSISALSVRFNDGNRLPRLSAQ